jgi:HSP20 family protein
MFGSSLTGFPDSLFDGLWRLHDSLLEELFSDSGDGGIRSLPRGSFPSMNIVNTADAVYVYLFAPGIDPKTLGLTLQQNLLTVEGQRSIRLDEKATHYRQERFAGDFRRSVALPQDVDPEQVHASYRDGIVEIRVQRQQSAQPRQIEIH